MNFARRLLEHDKPLLMGILNITPDSFSDGGLHFDPADALRRAREMLEQGADILDVGGESTRPGSTPVAAATQIERVLPVIRALRQAFPDMPFISIDTTHAEVARAALEAGASIINDVSAGRDDPAMLPLAAEFGAPIVLMHMQGTPLAMQDNPYYEDVVEEVLAFLLGRAEAALAAGVARENLILDPGIGFGKRRDDNLMLMANLHRLAAAGYPILLGASRKRFMGAVCNESRPAELVAATVAATTIGVMAGVRIFRVHDVKENRQAVDVAHAIRAFSR